MNRGSGLGARLIVLSALGAVATAAVAAPPKSETRITPQASLTLAPLGSSPLLAPRAHEPRPWRDLMSVADPAVAGLVAPPRYVIGKEGTAATGRRATLRVSLGETSLVAVSGKLGTRPRAGADPVVRDDQRSSAPHRLESGRLIGAGVERRFGRLELGAQLQYSTITAEELDPTGTPSMTGIDVDRKNSSKSVRATMRLRF